MLVALDKFVISFCKNLVEIYLRQWKTRKKRIRECILQQLQTLIEFIKRSLAFIKYCCWNISHHQEVLCCLCVDSWEILALGITIGFPFLIKTH